MRRFDADALMGYVYNGFIISLAVINAFYCIEPHFTGESLNMDHVFLSVFVALFFMAFLLFSQKVSVITVWAVAMIVFSGAFVLVRAPIVSIQYLTKWLEFIVSMMLYFIVLTQSHKIKRHTWNFLFLTSLAVVFVYFIEIFDMEFYLETGNGDFLLLSFENQNSAAMQLLLIGSVFFLFAKKYWKERCWVRCIISLVTIAPILYMIYLTGSRSSLIAALFLGVCFFIPMMDKLLRRPIIILALIFPLIFAIVLVSLYENDVNKIIFLDRNLFNGREVMWQSVFDQPLVNTLFGAYHEYTVIGQPPFQLHNGIVDMIASYGILITGGFLFGVYKLVMKLKSQNTAIAIQLVLCVLALIIQTTGEAALLLGGRCTYIAILLLFANPTAMEEPKEKKKKEEFHRNSIPLKNGIAKK